MIICFLRKNVLILCFKLKNNPMVQFEILPMIFREMKRKHISAADIARILHINPSTVHGTLNRKTMQVQKLVELSEILQYNFFKEIADQLPYSEPEQVKERPDNHIEMELREKVKALEMEVGILRQTLRDVVRR
jgi:predicted transcriptional regulator